MSCSYINRTDPVSIVLILNRLFLKGGDLYSCGLGFDFCISPLCEYIQFLCRFEQCWIESKKTLRNLQVSSFLKRKKKLVKKVLEDSNSLDFKNT